MGNLKAYRGFCNRINNAALNHEKVNITIECDEMMCSGMHYVEPLQENEEVIEIIAEENDLIFEKSPSLCVSYNEEDEKYIISNGKFVCSFM